MAAAWAMRTAPAVGDQHLGIADVIARSHGGPAENARENCKALRGFSWEVRFGMGDAMDHPRTVAIGADGLGRSAVFRASESPRLRQELIVIYPAFTVPVRRIAIVAALAAVSVSSGLAVDQLEKAGDDLGNPRLVAQVLFGTSGFEPGVAVEWRFSDKYTALVRPEVFLNEDSRPGFGVSLGCELGFLGLPQGQAITVGPRVVYHNSDDSGWAGDVLAIYHFNLRSDGHATGHFLEAIGALGVLEDKRDDNSGARLGASVGVAYGFQF